VHEGRHYLVTGGNLNASKGGQAVVNVYRAENEELTEWKYLGVLFQHPDANVKSIECPNFFKLGEKWVLIVSQGQPVQYFIGRLEATTPTPSKGLGEAGLRFEAEKRGVMDYGNYYAPNSMDDGKGHRVLWGWVRGFPAGRGWNGCLTLPRILEIGSDGELVQDPAPELQKLRGERQLKVAGLQLKDSSKLDLRGDALEIELRLDPVHAKNCGLRIGRSEVGRSVSIGYDGKQLDVAGLRTPLTLSEKNRTLELHIFLDRSVLEVYANHGICLTRVIDANSNDLGIELFNKGEDFTIRSLEVWPMTSIWPSKAGGSTR